MRLAPRVTNICAGSLPPATVSSSQESLHCPRRSAVDKTAQPSELVGDASTETPAARQGTPSAAALPTPLPQGLHLPSQPSSAWGEEGWDRAGRRGGAVVRGGAGAGSVGEAASDRRGGGRGGAGGGAGPKRGAGARGLGRHSREGL